MESLDLNKGLLESSPDCIKLLDLEAHLLFMNRGGCKALEIDDFSEIANAYWLDFWKGPYADAARTAIEIAKAGGVGHFQGYCPTWKGTPKWWDVLITPILGAHGKPERLLAISRDITETMQAQDNLREALEQLQLITDNLVVGVTRCSRDLRYMWVSRSYGDWLGLAPEDIAGRPILEVIGKKGFATIRPHIERVIAGEREEYETQVNYRGTVKWVHLVYVPTRGKDQKVDGWIAVVTDVTDRHNAEHELRQSEERFRNMADSAPVALWVTGPDGLATFYNKNALRFSGLTLEQLGGSTWTELVHPDDRSACQSAYSSALAEQGGFRIECRIRRADGEYRWVLCSGVPRFSPDGLFAGYLGTSVDITDLKHVHEAAMAAQKLESLGTLAAGIAHDFNNLLGGVLAQAELGLEELPEGSSLETELKAIRQAAMRGSEIVRELMIYAGKETAVAGDVDVSQVVEEMLELLQVSVSKHAMLETNLKHDLPAVQASAAQLRQVVLNLVTNASEAIGDQDGLILVRTDYVKVDLGSMTISGSLAPGDYVLLEISDTGRGLPLEMQAKVFDPFFTTKSIGQGHGLGLAVVRGIVHGLDGVIQLASEPGSGTTFKIYLPCAETKADVSRDVVASVGEPGGGGPSQDVTVLVVEDEALLRQAVTKMLRKTGFEVFEASDGVAAIDVIRASEGKIDVILLDLTIPGASSAEVAAEAVKARPAIKVILTSAYGQELVTGAMEALAVHPFIRKPFQLAALVQTLRNVLSPKANTVGAFS